MKKLILLLLLISTTLVAQKKITYSGYIPLITRHYIADTRYAPNQGGRIGLILNRKVSHTKYFTETSFGALENSYGEFSTALIQSIGKELCGLSVSLGTGITTGYHIIYDTRLELRESVPGILSNNGLMPFIGVSISLSKGLNIIDGVEISPLIIITPMFVNAGIKINLD